MSYDCDNRMMIFPAKYFSGGVTFRFIPAAKPLALLAERLRRADTVVVVTAA